MQKIRKVLPLWGNGLSFTLAGSIESIAPLILTPVLTFYFSTASYGIWAIFLESIYFLQKLLSLSFDDFIRIQYFRQSRQQIAKYLISIILLSSAISAILWIACLLFGESFSIFLRFPKDDLWTIISAAWLLSLFYLLLAYHQFESSPRRFALIHCIQAAITLAVSLILVIAGWSWKGAVFGKVAGLLAGTAIAWRWIVCVLPDVRWKNFHPGDIRALLLFGLQYLPNGMVFVTVFYTDRLLLAHLVGLEAVGLFYVASVFPVILRIPMQGYLLAWQRWCFSRLQSQDGKLQELLGGASLYFAAMPIGALLLLCLTDWLGPYVIDKKFYDSFIYLSPLMFACVMQGYYMFAQTILQYYQRIKVLSVIALATIFINLLLNIIMIPSMGIAGAGWATAIAYGAGFLMTLFVALRLLANRRILSFPL